MLTKKYDHARPRTRRQQRSVCNSIHPSLVLHASAATPQTLRCIPHIHDLPAVSFPVTHAVSCVGLLQRRAGGAGACRKGTRAQRRRRAYVCPLARRRVMRAPPYACAAAASPPLLGQASRGPARTTFVRGATAARLPSSSAARRARRRVVDAAHVAHAGHRARRRAAGRGPRRGRAANGAGGRRGRLWARASAPRLLGKGRDARTVMSEVKLRRRGRGVSARRETRRAHANEGWRCEKPSEGERTRTG